MKIVIEPANKNFDEFKNIDGVILSLQDFSVQSNCYYTKEEIAKIKKEHQNLEIFVKINKNIFNHELKALKETLVFLSGQKITGIFFYDLAVLKLKKELDLSVELVWDQTHMVNNSTTCNHYYEKGVKYALLGKEITLEEIKHIVRETKITPMVEVVGIPSVAFSRRKLITNYYKYIQEEGTNELEIKEKITNKNYYLTEDQNGTSFFLKEIVNGTGVIKDLYEINTPYIIMRELGLEKNEFQELIMDTQQYIKGNCLDENYILKYKKLGENTNFFFQKTIYQVKRNG